MPTINRVKAKQQDHFGASNIDTSRSYRHANGSVPTS